MGELRGTFHFHATDVSGEWQVEISPGQVEVLRQHAKAPVAVRGPASDLELLIYNRRRAEGLEVFGDAALLDAWRQVVRI
jgi:predicted lipid carrier protein YhbT